MGVLIPFSWPTFQISPEWTLFLDRDGVINERLPGDYVREWDSFSFLPGVLEALGLLSGLFGRIIVVTNQAGIEKGLMTHEQLTQIHELMMEYIRYHGGDIDEIYYCPYTAASEPFCRKPNPGMALEAVKDFPEIRLSKSLMVGDSDSDIAFGNRLGMKTILVGDKPDNRFALADSIPDCKMASLADVAAYFHSLHS